MQSSNGTSADAAAGISATPIVHSPTPMRPVQDRLAATVGPETQNNQRTTPHYTPQQMKSHILQQRQQQQLAPQALHPTPLLGAHDDGKAVSSVAHTTLNVCRRYVILDLDETIVSTKTRCNRRDCPHTAVRVGHHMLFIHWRPYAQQFLRCCMASHVGIVVFSAGKSRYVKTVCRTLQRLWNIRFAAIFTSDHLDPGLRGINTKNLDVVLSMLQTQRENVLAIDDAKHNYMQQDDFDRVLRIQPWDVDVLSASLSSLTVSPVDDSTISGSAFSEHDTCHVQHLHHHQQQKPVASSTTDRHAVPYSGLHDDDWLCWAWSYIAHEWGIVTPTMYSELIPSYTNIDRVRVWWSMCGASVWVYQVEQKHLEEEDERAVDEDEEVEQQRYHTMDDMSSLLTPPATWVGQAVGTSDAEDVGYELIAHDMDDDDNDYSKHQQQPLRQSDGTLAAPLLEVVYDSSSTRNSSAAASSSSTPTTVTTTYTVPGICVSTSEHEHHVLLAQPHPLDTQSMVSQQPWHSAKRRKMEHICSCTARTCGTEAHCYSLDENKCVEQCISINVAASNDYARHHNNNELPA